MRTWKTLAGAGALVSALFLCGCPSDGGKADAPPADAAGDAAGDAADAAGDAADAAGDAAKDGGDAAPAKKMAVDISHVKKGQNVIVIAGNDKGRTGEVKKIINKTGRVVVEGVNLRWKHKRPTPQNQQGERVQEECSIHASNVMPVDPATGKGTRKRQKAEA